MTSQRGLLGSKSILNWENTEELEKKTDLSLSSFKGDLLNSYGIYR